MSSTTAGGGAQLVAQSGEGLGRRSAGGGRPGHRGARPGTRDALLPGQDLRGAAGQRRRRTHDVLLPEDVRPPDPLW